MMRRRNREVGWLGLASLLWSACQSDGTATPTPLSHDAGSVSQDAIADRPVVASDVGTDAGAAALDLGVAPPDVVGDTAPYPVMSGPRDWSAYPAIIGLDRPADAPVYAVSDVHGGYDRLVALLALHGVISSAPTDPSSVRWSAGHAVLVVTGDMIDKGPSSLEVIDLVQALQAGATAQS